MGIALPKQAFIALAAVGWADGSLRPAEGAALVRAARECGLEGTDLTDVESSTKASVSIDTFDPGQMGRWDRTVTYALASWLAAIDGVVSTDESTTLAKLGERLDLEVPIRRRATAAAFDISVLPEGGRPDKYDFAKLVARIRERLPQVSA
jgi:hypothetical protein